MDLISNFFTHKDFLPPASEIAGTMFTPLHFCFAAVLLAAIIFFSVYLSKKGEKAIKAVFFVIWAAFCVLEVAKIVWESTAGQAIGYKEILLALEGSCTMDEAREAIKQATRNYAKRQLTWFRRNENIHWLYPDEDGDLVNKVLKHLTNRL